MQLHQTQKNVAREQFRALLNERLRIHKSLYAVSSIKSESEYRNLKSELKRLDNLLLSVTIKND